MTIHSKTRDLFAPFSIKVITQYAVKVETKEEADISVVSVLPESIEGKIARAEAAITGLLASQHATVIGLQQLFAIDAMWSLQAYHRPFHALKIYRDVFEDGMRFPVPLLSPFERPKSMPEKFFYVGANWDEGDRLTYTGLRSVLHEFAAMDSDGCMGSRTLNDGREVMAINTDDLLSFNEDTASFLLNQELNELIKKYHDDPKANPTQAYYYYATLGMMSVKAGAEGEIDRIMRRSNFKVRNALAGQQDPQALMARAVSAQEAGLVKREKTVKAKSEAGSLSTPHLDLLSEAELAAV